MDGLNREISDFDIIIKNGTLVDGTGTKSKLGDLAIKKWYNWSYREFFG